MTLGPDSPFSLTGRLAVVTGVRRGIGLAMAEALAGAGADVVGVSATLEPDGGAAGQRVQAHGRLFWAMAADFADRNAVRALIERLEALDRPIDILVNNAGTIVRAPAAEHPDEAWDHVWRSTSRHPSCSPGRSGREWWRADAARSSSPRRC